MFYDPRANAQQLRIYFSVVAEAKLLRYIHSLTMCLMFPLFQALKRNKKIITTQCSVLLDLRT